MNAPLILRKPDDTADLRWAIYLRMLNKPELINEAITGDAFWNDFDVDLDDLEAQAIFILEQPDSLTSHRIATLRAALTALDGIRQARLTND